MTAMPSAIPGWNATGCLPPNSAQASVTPVDRSPYSVSLVDLALRFNVSPARQTILMGLLDLRAELHRIGIVTGFQWLDGSFLEDIETIEKRPPNDMDVVTFFRLPAGVTQAQTLAQSRVFGQPYAKATYHIDAYWVELGMQAEDLVMGSAYWYSMWAHRRSGEWKGFLQIDLAPTDDVAARANLATLVTP